MPALKHGSMQEKKFFVLNQQNSVANHFLTEIRKKGFQDDRLRFRRNLERIGELLAYELSKTLSYVEQPVETPLENTSTWMLDKQPVLVSVLRAGLPLHIGVLNYFDQADNGFVGAFRDHPENDTDFEIAMQYFAIPEISGKQTILIDPMLASGRTLVDVSHKLFEQGSPDHLHIISAIASPEGISHLRQSLNLPFSLWLGAVDDHLNSKAYIVPGLGDAGDLAFGPKN